MRYTLDEAIQSKKTNDLTDNPYYLMTISVFALIASCQRKPSGNIWIAYIHREQLLNRIDVLYPLY